MQHIRKVNFKLWKAANCVYMYVCVCLCVLQVHHYKTGE